MKTVKSVYVLRMERNRAHADASRSAEDHASTSSRVLLYSRSLSQMPFLKVTVASFLEKNYQLDVTERVSGLTGCFATHYH